MLTRTQYRHRELYKSIPGAEWDGHRWTYLASPITAMALTDLLGENNVSLAVAKLADALVEQGEVGIPALAEPWPHQREAFHKLMSFPGAMLGLDMGTGKTAVAIWMANARDCHKLLVICPLSVVAVWPDEFAKHSTLPWQVIALDSGSVADKSKEAEHALAGSANRVAVVVNYESSWRQPFRDFALSTAWDMVVADECVAEGTLIETQEGSVPIEQIKQGDHILGFVDDVYNNRFEETRVLHVFERINYEPMRVVHGRGNEHYPFYTCLTWNHPVNTPAGYVPTILLQEGDGLHYFNRERWDRAHAGEFLEAKLAWRGGEDKGVRVFNLETETGNYVANGLVVHNCHRIKQPGGKTSLFFRHLRETAKWRLGMSGTPLPHSLLDAYAQYRFLDPGVFGSSFVRFRSQYALMGGFKERQVIGFQNTEDFHKRFYSIAYRVTADEVLDLPETVYSTRVCSMPNSTKKIYDNLSGEFWSWVESERAKGPVSITNALVKLLRLQQVTSGFVTTDDGETVELDEAKGQVLCDFLEDLPEKEPVVIFARFLHDLDIIAQVCDKCGREYAELSGRKKELQVWQDANGPSVLGTQIQAGSLGIDLTRARIAVFFSMGLSLGDYQQALKRLHRPGQTRSVLYTHILSQGTVDRKIHKALMDRRDVIEAILSGGKEDGD